MITVEVTTTNYVVNASETSANVTVTADNSIFTVTSVAQTFTVTNVTPVITFQSEGAGFDFISKNRGQWVSGTRYYRNDVVYYEYSTYICAVNPLDYVESATPPPQDPTNWELFIFNEWPRAYLTVTNWLNVGTTATINTLSVTNTATVGGNLNVGGDLDVNGNFDLSSGKILAAYGTFTNRLQVGLGATTGTFAINGLEYPHNKGVYGQVLYTNGSTNAAWVNLGELVFWQLSEDLKTEGFNIVSAGAGNQLTIGGGVTGNFHNSIKFNTSASGATLELNAPLARFNNNVRINNGLRVDGDITAYGDINIADNKTLAGFDHASLMPTVINVSTGFRFPDGTIQTSAFSLSTASTSVKGGIKVGDGLYMSGEFLNVKTATTTTLGGVIVGEYLSINTTTSVLTVNTTTLGAALGSLTYQLPIATTSTLGGVKVGETVSVNTVTGILNVKNATTNNIGGIQVGDFLSVTTDTAILSVNTSTLIPFISQYGLPIATTSTLGGIVVGEYLDINTSTGVLSINTATLGPALVDVVLPVASDTTLGGVRVPLTSTIAINTTTGAITVPLATTSILGVVKVGSGLSIAGDGTVSLNSANSYGNISLTEDMETNGYNIRRSSTYNGVQLSLGTDQAVLQGGVSGVNVTVANNGVRINTLNTSGHKVEILSPVVVAGYDIYNSKVQASSYYNFEGTGAAFFPANIKFSDDTIQRTAWRGYDQGLI